jgi:hypothetical protein
VELTRQLFNLSPELHELLGMYPPALFLAPAPGFTSRILNAAEQERQAADRSPELSPAGFHDGAEL